MEQMRIKHNETGRSMVEMLGVLAVVGVLSIGGVAGYRYAVDKMNANEIINELKKRAITASQQRVLGQDINLSEYGNNGAIKGYTVTPTTKYNENASQFALAVAGVPERVCDMILESDWALPTEKVVANGSCVDGGNTLTFAFNNTLESGDAGNGNNGGNGDEGNDTPVTEPTDTPTQQCGENEYRLADGTCQLDTNCSDPNQFWNGYEEKCTSCPTEGNPVRNYASDIEDTCNKCQNAQTARGNGDNDFYCIYCPAERVVCGDTCCESGQQCKRDGYQYECVSGLGEGECLTNADCNNGLEIGEYYCKNTAGCARMVGMCEKVSQKTIQLDNNTTYITTEGSPMGWQAAKNFCLAIGSSLVSAEKHCTADEWSIIQANGGKGICDAWKSSSAGYLHFWTETSVGSCLFNDVVLYTAEVENGVTGGSAGYAHAPLCEKVD